MTKPEGTKASPMESALSGFVINPSKYSQLSLEERRQLVYEIYQLSEDAPKVLSSLTRRDLLEIICAEMGKERKYSGFTKSRMIEHLSKLFSFKSMTSTNTQLDSSPYQSGGSGLKRQCIKENLCLPNECDEEMEDKSEVLLCQNLACRAILNAGDAFCRRCSCCICHQYDDNKDPSLWLICYSDYPDEPGSCGLSCHLKCSLSHERSGILMNGPCAKLDGHFYCVSCGKINDLMRTLRKQLVVAKDARRVDVLCLRISLSHKILQNTEQYKGLLQVVESAVHTLENEVGPLDLASEKMDRSIVNRLSCGTAVQKLCASAVEAFDSLFLDQCIQARKQEPPSCNPMPYEERGGRENAPMDVAHLRAESIHSSDNKVALTENPSKLGSLNDIESKQRHGSQVKRVPAVSPISSAAPATPCKSGGTKEVPLVGCKRQAKESNYEYSVGVIRRLEHEGHIKTEFRVKFLTWFSLKATTQERRVVSIFINTFIDDPSGLAGQLMHTFMDKVCGEQKAVSHHVLCTRFWH